MERLYIISKSIKKMKIKLLVIFIGALFLSVSAYSQSSKYFLKGTINRSHDGQLAVLYKMDEKSIVFKTDTTIIEEGSFYFEGNEFLSNLSSVHIVDKLGSKTGQELELLLESGNIFVDFKGDRPILHGTPQNNLYMIYTDSIKFFNNTIIEIEPKWTTEIVIFPDSELEYQYFSMGNYIMNFIKNNYNKELGKILLMRNLDLGVIPIGIYVSKNLEKLDEIFAFVDNKTRNHPRFISFMESINSAKYSSEIVGKKVSDFLLITPEGNEIYLTAYIGKKDYVFVEFWASWCKPCLQSIPQFKEIYSKYSDRLEIVSISLDMENAGWINALKTQGMEWPQLANFEGFDSDIAEAFRIKSIPLGFIVNKDGTILYIGGSMMLKLFVESKLN